MKNKPTTITAILVAATGAIIWLVIQNLTGKTEAWDSGLYFQVGLPLMALLSGVGGYLDPPRWWLWGPLMVFTQLVTLAATSLIAGKAVGGLFIFGIILFGILAVPCTFAAFGGKKLRESRMKASS